MLKTDLTELFTTELHVLNNWVTINSSSSCIKKVNSWCQ